MSPEGPGFGEVGHPHFGRLGLGPLLQTHLVDEAEIEDLGVVWQLGVGVEVVAGKIVTLAAVIHAALLETLVGLVEL